MINALNELQDFQIINSLDDEETEEMVAYLYLAIRLKPLLKNKTFKEQDIDTICAALAKHYLNNNVSLDLMINAVYNYINTTKKCPSVIQLNDDIEVFLEDNTDE